MFINKSANINNIYVYMYDNTKLQNLWEFRFFSRDLLFIYFNVLLLLYYYYTIIIFIIYYKLII